MKSANTRNVLYSTDPFLSTDEVVWLQIFTFSSLFQGIITSHAAAHPSVGTPSEL